MSRTSAFLFDVSLAPRLRRCFRVQLSRRRRRRFLVRLDRAYPYRLVPLIRQISHLRFAVLQLLLGETTSEEWNEELEVPACKTSYARLQKRYFHLLLGQFGQVFRIYRLPL